MNKTVLNRFHGISQGAIASRKSLIHTDNHTPTRFAASGLLKLQSHDKRGKRRQALRVQTDFPPVSAS